MFVSVCVGLLCKLLLVLVVHSCSILYCDTKKSKHLFIIIVWFILFPLSHSLTLEISRAFYLQIFKCFIFFVFALRFVIPLIHGEKFNLFL